MGTTAMSKSNSSPASICVVASTPGCTRASKRGNKCIHARDGCRQTHVFRFELWRVWPIVNDVCLCRGLCFKHLPTIRNQPQQLPRQRARALCRRALPARCLSARPCARAQAPARATLPAAAQSRLCGLRSKHGKKPTRNDSVMVANGVFSHQLQRCALLLVVSCAEKDEHLHSERKLRTAAALHSQDSFRWLSAAPAAQTAK